MSVMVGIEHRQRALQEKEATVLISGTMVLRSVSSSVTELLPSLHIHVMVWSV